LAEGFAEQGRGIGRRWDQRRRGGDRPGHSSCLRPAMRLLRSLWRDEWDCWRAALSRLCAARAGCGLVAQPLAAVDLGGPDRLFAGKPRVFGDDPAAPTALGGGMGDRLGRGWPANAAAATPAGDQEPSCGRYPHNPTQ